LGRDIPELIEVAERLEVVVAINAAISSARSPTFASAQRATCTCFEARSAFGSESYALSRITNAET
jgi:hypothetical protein